VSTLIGKIEIHRPTSVAVVRPEPARLALFLDDEFPVGRVLQVVDRLRVVEVFQVGCRAWLSRRLGSTEARHGAGVILSGKRGEGPARRRYAKAPQRAQGQQGSGGFAADFGAHEDTAAVAAAFQK